MSPEHQERELGRSGNVGSATVAGSPPNPTGDIHAWADDHSRLTRFSCYPLENLHESFPIILG